MINKLLYERIFAINIASYWSGNETRGGGGGGGGRGVGGGLTLEKYPPPIPAVASLLPGVRRCSTFSPITYYTAKLRFLDQTCIHSRRYMSPYMAQNVDTVWSILCGAVLW